MNFEFSSLYTYTSEPEIAKTVWNSLNSNETGQIEPRRRKCLGVSSIVWVPPLWQHLSSRPHEFIEQLTQCLVMQPNEFLRFLTRLELFLVLIPNLSTCSEMYKWWLVGHSDKPSGKNRWYHIIGYIFGDIQRLPSPVEFSGKDLSCIKFTGSIVSSVKKHQ